MKNARMHLRKRHLHRTKPELNSNRAYQNTNAAQTSSAWVRRLTTRAIDPQVVHHHLLGAGERLSSQTLKVMQRQNGNRYIQREALPIIQRDDDDLMVPDINTVSGPAAPVPIPYPNTSNLTGSSQASSSVNMTNKNALTQKSQVSQISGDEAGTLKGMRSTVNMDKLKYKKYSSKIKTRGANAVFIPPEETPVSRTVDKAAGSVGEKGGLISNQLADRIDRNLGKGSPLVSGKQAQMESIFGTDFSDVRLHTGQEADSLNQKLSAHAFTIGNDIFFNHTANPQDNALLTHELTHVVQQQRMPAGGPLTVGPADDRMERQATQNADSAATNAYAFTFEEQRIQRDHMNQSHPGRKTGKFQHI